MARRDRTTTRAKIVPISLPYKGIDESSPYDAMPEGSCVDVVNMRPYQSGDSNPANQEGDRYGLSRRGALEIIGIPGNFNINGVASAIVPFIRTDGVTGVVLYTSNGENQVFENQSDFFTLAHAPTGTLGPTASGLQAAHLGDYAYALRTRTNLNTGVNDDWGTAVTSTGAGTLPASSQLEIMATYRGRIVAAEEGKDEFRMSRVGDPNDWDYGSTPEATSAYEGNSLGTAGVPGDGIRALIPYFDDQLVFGCNSSMWVMEGDPANGGIVVNLTYDTGIVGKHAWAFDDDGNLWFVGNGDLWRIPKGGLTPQNITNGRLKRTLGRFRYEDDFTNMEIDLYLSFDSLNREVHLLFYDQNGGTEKNQAYIYNIPTDGLFRDEFDRETLNVAPTCSSSIGGRGPALRTTLLGTTSGEIAIYRRPDEEDQTSAADLMRSPFTCSIDFAPINFGSDRHESMAMQLRITGAQTSHQAGDPDYGSATIQWHTGESAAEVATQADGGAAYSTTMFESSKGFQKPVTLRKRGRSHQLRLRHTATDKDFRLASAEVDLALQASMRRVT